MELAAEAARDGPGDIEYRDGAFQRIAGTDAAIGLAELAATQPEKRSA